MNDTRTIVQIFRGERFHSCGPKTGVGILGGKKYIQHFKRKRGKKLTIGEKATMDLACISKHVSESLPPANTGKFSKLLKR